MRNQLRTIALLGVLSVGLISLGGALGPAWLVGFTVLAFAMNLGAWFFSDRMVLAMHRAVEVGPDELPQVRAMVAELANRAGLPMPKVYRIADPTPNAFATGRSPDKGVVAVTDGILAVLTPRELRAVIAHELAHIQNRDTLVATVAAGLAGAITSIANALQFSALFGGSDEEEEGGGFGALAFAFVAPIAASLVQLGISRSREYMADQTGAAMCGDPGALADALEKLHHPHLPLTPEMARPATASLMIASSLSTTGGWTKWFSTHPPYEERVSRLRAMDLERRTGRALVA